MALGHLVIGAATLEDGVAWCERVLGLTPDGGGKHVLMGTHNRLLNISNPPAYPRCYLEIIAIDPEAAPPQGRARWFDLDRLELTEPGLIHRVERVDDLDAALREQPDAGTAVAASRGALNWRIALREDGRRMGPTLIEWGDAHPTDTMPERGLKLLSLEPVRLQKPDGDIVTLEWIG